MTNLITILKKLKKLEPSDSFQVVEFFGTPGSGKTFLANILYNQVNLNSEMEALKYSSDIGKMPTLKRVIVKMVIVFYLLIVSPCTLINIVKFVKVFHHRNNKVLIKLVFNFIYVVGLILFCKKYNKILIMDQGITQAVWSCIFHGDNSSFNTDNASNFLIIIFSKIKITNLLMVNLKVSKENIKSRLHTRKVKGTSILNTEDEKILDKGINTSLEALEFFSNISKNISFFSIHNHNNN